MMKNKFDYVDIEEAAIRVIKALLEINAPMEDIVYLSGKSEDFINNIK